MFYSFLIILKILFQKIGEEKEFQNSKHNKKLNKDDEPELFTLKTHIPESFIIKLPYFFYHLNSFQREQVAVNICSLII